MANKYYTKLLDSESVCGFDLEFYKKFDGQDLSYYYDSISTLSEEYTKTSEVPDVVFPIMFYVLKDQHMVNVNINPYYIVKWINYWFSGSGISFIPQELDSQGNVMSTPGLGSITASVLAMANYYNSDTNSDYDRQSYPVSGVYLNRNIDSSETVPSYLNDVDSIRNSNYFIRDNCINVVFVNYINTDKSTEVVMTSNSHLAGHREMTPIINLSALGRSSNFPHEKGNKKNPDSIFDLASSNNDIKNFSNFSYDYETTSPFMGSPILDHWKTKQQGSAIMARSVVHSLGHVFGLSHVRTGLNVPSASYHTCSYVSKTMFKDPIQNNTVYKDPFSDTTQNRAGLDQVRPYSGATTCAGDPIEDVYLTHMHNTLYYPDKLDDLGDRSTLGAGLKFSPQQIAWMRANINYIQENGELGVLGKIQQSLDQSFTGGTFEEISNCAAGSRSRASATTHSNISALLTGDSKYLHDSLSYIDSIINSIQY